MSGVTPSLTIQLAAKRRALTLPRFASDDTAAAHD
jgi:hypothetical protein